MAYKCKYDDVVNNLKRFGYFVDTNESDYTGANKVLCHDSNGYKYIITRYYAVIKALNRIRSQEIIRLLYII